MKALLRDSHSASRAARNVIGVLVSWPWVPLFACVGVVLASLEGGGDAGAPLPWG
jgi:hypothetical protein